MTTVYLVRHGRASAGWDSDPDPGLDELGERQARDVGAHLAPLGPLTIVSSPLLRCQHTAAPLSRAWRRPVIIDSRVAEIPSPDGVAMGERVPWLRAAMQGHWADLGERYTDFRDGVVEAVSSLPADTVVFSHFVAINAVIGAALGDDRLVISSLDNCSVTVVDVTPSGLVLRESGREADTLIR